MEQTKGELTMTRWLADPRNYQYLGGAHPAAVRAPAQQRIDDFAFVDTDDSDFAQLARDQVRGVVAELEALRNIPKSGDNIPYVRGICGCRR